MLNPKAFFIAQKSFKINGRPFKPGDPFNWKRLGVSWRRVVQLSEGRFIGETFDDPNLEDGEGQGQQGPDGEGLDGGGTVNVVHNGGGWYDVFNEDGDRINDKPLRKPEADELAESWGNPDK